MTLAAGSKLGPYEILGQIGAGGTGAEELIFQSSGDKSITVVVHWKAELKK